MIPEIFKYETPEKPIDCKYLISPSQIYKFFSFPKTWYEENILGLNPEFQGDTSTYIGTICHYVYECVTNGSNVNREIINKQLEDYLTIKPNENVDKDLVMSIYPLVVNEVVNKYVLPNNQIGGILECEKKVITKLDDNIYVGGSVDRIEGSIVCDYKTVSTKPNENEIPFNYKIQLLAYAYILRSKGYLIDRIRLIYGIKPTKTLPARCVVVTENITYEDEKLINDTLHLISDTIKLSIEHPEYNYMLFKSYSLKGD